VAYFELEALHDEGVVTLTVRDTGRWRAPRGANRGRGLKMIAAAVDELDVHTTDAGTEVVMRRRLGRA
jgi:anti-sigma regulatory factor (Ser/Thr protein kinase)